MDHESDDFTWELQRFLDKGPGRWTTSEIGKVLAPDGCDRRQGATAFGCEDPYSETLGRPNQVPYQFVTEPVDLETVSNRIAVFHHVSQILIVVP